MGKISKLDAGHVVGLSRFFSVPLRFKPQIRVRMLAAGLPI